MGQTNPTDSLRCTCTLYESHYTNHTLLITPCSCQATLLLSCGRTCTRIATPTTTDRGSRAAGDVPTRTGAINRFWSINRFGAINRFHQIVVGFAGSRPSNLDALLMRSRSHNNNKRFPTPLPTRLTALPPHTIPPHSTPLPTLPPTVAVVDQGQYTILAILTIHYTHHTSNSGSGRPGSYGYGVGNGSSWDAVMGLMGAGDGDGDADGAGGSGGTAQHAAYTIRHTPCTIHHTPCAIRQTPYTIRHIQYTIRHTSNAIHSHA
jgi:hypothetical protein